MITPYVYYARVTGVHDGDTLKVNLDLGLDTWRNDLNVRLSGVNCIELKDAGGVEARDFLRELLPVGCLVLVESIKYDKFGGRVNAKVYAGGAIGPEVTDVSSQLIAAGYAVAWNGKGPKPVPAWPLVPKPV